MQESGSSFLLPFYVGFQKAKELLLQAIPLGKLGQPEDVAKAVLFLSSSDSSYITGQVINVDGGMVMQ